MDQWKTISEELASRVGFRALKEASEALSHSYREGRATTGPRLSDEQLLAAYLTVRYPATKAVNERVAQAIRERMPDFVPDSLLDVGAGCGASLAGFAPEFPSLKILTALEQLPAMARVGKQLVEEAQWRTVDFRQLEPWPKHAVVLASYAFNEAARSFETLIEKAWAATEQIFVLIEPGTQAGADLIGKARTQLLAAGGHLVAPCPNANECPEPWCHFDVRINRTSMHRKVKGGEIGWEDEKYSYLVVSRTPIEPSAPRILRHPLIQPGKIEFVLCNAPKKSSRYALKRNKTEFRFARKAKWGDLYEPPQEDAVDVREDED